MRGLDRRGKQANRNGAIGAERFGQFTLTDDGAQGSRNGEARIVAAITREQVPDFAGHDALCKSDFVARFVAEIWEGALRNNAFSVSSMAWKGVAETEGFEPSIPLWGMLI
jgi:hypothetical protein